MSQPGMRGIRTEPFLLSQGTGIIFENMLGQMSSGIRVVSYLHPPLASASQADHCELPPAFLRLWKQA